MSSKNPKSVDRIDEIEAQSETQPSGSLSKRRFKYKYAHHEDHWIDISLAAETGLVDMSKREMAGEYGGSTPSDKTPLLQDRLMRSLSGVDQHESYGVEPHTNMISSDATPRESPSPSNSNENRTLGTFAGVFAPVALSIFSTLLFLRMGFVVGQAGILFTLLILFISYLVLGLTILSICAISTNGAVEGGGAYFMISRTLGPEFGGSLGLLFFLANSFASALYIAGFVEAIVENFGPGGEILGNNPGLPDGYWWRYLYKTTVNIFNVVICLLGAGVFSFAAAGLFAITFLCYILVIVSFFVSPSKEVKLPATNQVAENVTIYGNYTGLSMHTFRGNLYGNFGQDYSSGNEQNFLTVYAVLFSSVTGIMAGANMSGELKNPNKAIPRGTVQATSFTLFCYTLLAFLVAFTCDNFLLKNDYNFLQAIDLHFSIVLIGTFVTTLSAAMGCLIGASRVLAAVAKDEVYGILLRPAMLTTASGNPVAAVLFSFLVVQCVSLAKTLNAIAPLVTVTFLLVYAFSNLACLSLELASAPNFRPTFHYYSWHTCFLGFLSCTVMSFLVNAVYTAVAIAILLLLVIFIWWYSPPAHAWGSISQALIFHQVRKYLLMLDSRREHVKYWRPQILLLVSNPKASCQLMDFVNDLKKGGLYVLGHVQVGSMDEFLVDPTIAASQHWLSLVDHLKVKAFVELTLATSVREGVQNLYRLSGLGGMKPNTVCMGFYDDCPQDNSMSVALAKKNTKLKKSQVDFDQIDATFPPTRSDDQSKSLELSEYMDIIFDILKSQKNVLVARNFQHFDKHNLSGGKAVVDVWPSNMLQPFAARILDTTSLLMLQLACILEMVESWHKVGALIRVFLCVNRDDDVETMRKNVKQVLTELRIPAKVVVVHWDDVTYLLSDDNTHSHADSGHAASSSVDPQPEKRDADPSRYQLVPDEYLQGINALVRDNSRDTTVTFMYLAIPPSEAREHRRYIEQYEWITKDIPPTVFVHGVSSVTTTVL